jgi:hypothetical protein
MRRSDVTATRAITIHAAAANVWPWVAQLGQGRGGFYSYDVLENLVGCDIHSANRIVPEWQHVEVGAEVKLHPQVALTVAVVEGRRAVVWRGSVPMGPMPAPYDCTWAFVLLDGPGHATRLVVRERYRYTRWWAALIVEPTASGQLSHESTDAARHQRAGRASGSLRHGVVRHYRIDDHHQSQDRVRAAAARPHDRWHASDISDDRDE